MRRGFRQPKRPPARTRLFCLGDPPHLGSDSFQKLGWVEGGKSPKPGGRPQSRWHIWLALPLHSFLPKTLGPCRQPRACPSPTSTPFVPARNADETVHSFPLPPAPTLIPTLGDTPPPPSRRPSPTSPEHPPPHFEAGAASPVLRMRRLPRAFPQPHPPRQNSSYTFSQLLFPPSQACGRSFPWISGALVDGNVDLCGKRQVGGLCPRSASLASAAL